MAGTCGMVHPFLCSRHTIHFNPTNPIKTPNQPATTLNSKQLKTASTPLATCARTARRGRPVYNKRGNSTIKIRRVGANQGPVAQSRDWSREGTSLIATRMGSPVLCYFCRDPPSHPHIFITRHTPGETWHRGRCRCFVTPLH